MRVEVDFEDIVLENENGREQDSVEATCSRCDHQTQAFGRGNKSRGRCLAALRDECPHNEDNFYVDKDPQSSDHVGLGGTLKHWWEKKI